MVVSVTCFGLGDIHMVVSVTCFGLGDTCMVSIIVFVAHVQLYLLVFSALASTPLLFARSALQLLLACRHQPHLIESHRDVAEVIAVQDWYKALRGRIFVPHQEAGKRPPPRSAEDVSGMPDCWDGGKGRQQPCY